MTLDPEGWFVRGHENDGGEENIDGVWIPKLRPGAFIYRPFPGVARIVIEELCQAWHNSTYSTLVII